MQRCMALATLRSEAATFLALPLRQFLILAISLLMIFIQRTFNRSCRMQAILCACRTVLQPSKRP
ncbi:hypothetical protein LY76DRAFT_9102 [Colletotrichum caudatum]|nr:hypothetical protein LY76DRAFT_9102 [Colletotrichum caudatum]